MKLSQILLCLEENIQDGREVLGQCVAEIKQIRREMMEGLQRHQDPAPGADHPLPYAAGVGQVADKCEKALDSTQVMTVLRWRMVSDNKTQKYFSRSNQIFSPFSL